MCLFLFLLYNQPFYMPPNIPRAFRKGAVSSTYYFVALASISAASFTFDLR